MASMNETPYMSPGEVAALFGVGADTVRLWADAGKVSYIRTPGGHYRYLKMSVAALLENSVTPTEATS